MNLQEKIETIEVTIHHWNRIIEDSIGNERPEGFMQNAREMLAWHKGYARCLYDIRDEANHEDKR